MRLSGNFKKKFAKIRKIFSQFLVLKDRFFKDRSFLYATEAPAQFLQETKRFARGLLKALGLTGGHQKCFRKILKFFLFSV